MNTENFKQDKKISRINFGNMSGILGNPMKSLKENSIDFFGIMGGLDRTLARDLDSVVRAKHIQFGVFLTIIVVAQACIAGSAWSELMHSISVGIFVFFAWLAVFGALDSVMMNLMNRELAKKNTYSFLSVFSRVVIIGFTSYLNSTMAEMRIFDAEIQMNIYEYRQEKLQNLSDEINARIDSLHVAKSENMKKVDQKSAPYTTWLANEQKKIDDQNILIQQRRTDLVLEVEGSSGSKKRGDGQVADAKRNAIMEEEQVVNHMITTLESMKQSRPEFIAMESERKSQEIANEKLDEQIAREEKNLEQQKADLGKMRNDGFLDRYHALGRIGGQNFLVWMVFGLFFFIETSILIVKLTMMGRDEYHDILVNHLNKIFKEKILSEKEQNERIISEHESNIGQILYSRIQQRTIDESNLHNAELVLYPVEQERIRDQFKHASDITEMIEKSAQEESVRRLFKFNWAKKFFRLQPKKMN